MTARSGPSARIEYRVTWRRASWAASTRNSSQVFATLEAAERFIRARLYGNARPDLSPLTLLELHWREVGEWQGDEP